MWRARKEYGRKKIIRKAGMANCGRKEEIRKAGTANCGRQGRNMEGKK